MAPDVIELQMAHPERNKVRAAYNRAERLAERRTMMQAWADYLDELRAGRHNLSTAAHSTDNSSQAQKADQNVRGNLARDCPQASITMSQLELALPLC